MSDRIAFNIAPAYQNLDGSATISPSTLLPTIADPVVVDGYTQPGASENTLAVGDNASIKVEISASLARALRVDQTQDVTIRGLAINGFSSEGIAIGLGTAQNVTIEGNFIGTNISGTQGVFTGSRGVFLPLADGVVIGGSTPAARNIIAGSTNGIVSSSANVTIEGNYIGTDASGTVRLNYLSGDSLSGRGVDGGQLVKNNVIAGYEYGLFDSYTVVGNKIGIGVTGANVVDGGGAPVLGNGTGMRVFGPSTRDRIIGGMTAGEGNVFSGNSTGIWIQQNGSVVDQGGISILGNYVGTDPTGTLARANHDGIYIPVDSGVLVAGNLVSGNENNGLIVGSGVGLASGNIIQGNKIGSDLTGILPLSNFIGVVINASAHATLVGGTQAGEGNVIAFNGSEGVLVIGNSTNNAIVGNSIHSNGRLGISLNAVDSATPLANDSQDTDAGNNNGQNYAVLSSVFRSGGNFAITGSLNSLPNTTFRIEFFDNASSDPSGFGEGEKYLGFTEVTTNGSGNTIFNASIPGVDGFSHYIGSTATRLEDQSGDLVPTDTSEFSHNVFLPANRAPVAADDSYSTYADQSVAGNVLSNDSDPDTYDVLTVTAVNGSAANVGQSIASAHGTFIVNADGTFTYTQSISCEAASDSFTYTISDGYGGTSTATVTINASTGVSIIGGALRVGGGAGADVVSVVNGKLKVNGIDYSLTGITEVRIWGHDGNDQIDLSGLSINSFIHGGKGNDTLTGGSGEDVILGGDEDDTITGAAGNDFLIGGTGKDRIVGSAGNDILVAGDVECGLNLAALRAISSAWSQSHSATNATVDDILDEVFADGNADQLTGSAAADLFIINSEDKITDFQFGKPNTNKEGDVVIRDGMVVA